MPENRLLPRRFSHPPRFIGFVLAGRVLLWALGRSVIASVVDHFRGQSFFRAPVINQQTFIG